MKGIKLYVKLVFTGLCAAFISTGCQENLPQKQNDIAHAGYTITGNIYNKDAATLYLVNTEDRVVDSALVTNTAFKLQGTIANPGAYHFVVNNIPQVKTILLENDTYNVLIDNDHMMVAGGDLHTKLSNYYRSGTSQNKLRLSLLDRFLAKDITNKQMQFSLDSLKKEYTTQSMHFIAENKDNILASIGLDNATLSLDAALKLTESTKDAKNKDFANTLKTQLASLQKEEETRLAAIKTVKEVEVYRAPAPYFTGESLNGSDIAFENILAGKKAVLIDFWASWCKPCRMVTPQVRSMYHKYKDQGFDVITVSLDKNRAAWKQGVLEDQMSSWNHVYDEYKYITSLYGARTIPHMVLVGADGKIIENKISITQLKSELTRIFK